MNIIRMVQEMMEGKDKMIQRKKMGKEREEIIGEE